MAAKIKEGLRDITQGVVERLKGGPKYADNLLGESLHDQLRKATAKDLLEPSEELNSQVVDTINQDIINGKDSKEIVGLVKKRLRTDNPHKQWLAVQLVGRVMRDCGASIAAYQEELLQEVARTMSRPARPDSAAGKVTRQAAKELLRSYGRAGTSAFRAVNRSALESASNAGDYPLAAHHAAVSPEAASVVAEVKALIEQAQANTELLSEMLVAEQHGGAGGSAGPGGDEFENELTRELVTEVRELRLLFEAYLEQMQSMSDPEVEATMIKALEAVDMLDGALALQQDVASNQRELEQHAVAGGAASASAAAPAAARAAEQDLISLDDLAEALLPQPQPVLGGVASPADPFAALSHSAVTSPSAAPPPAPAPAAPPSYPGMYGAVPQPSQPQPQPFQYAQQPQLAPQQQQQQPYGFPAATSYGGAMQAPAPVTNPNNPFASPGAPSLAFGASPPALAGPAASNNPFATTSPPAMTDASGGGGVSPAPTSLGNGVAPTVDSEWAMFFAGRAGGGAAPGQQQH